MVSKWQWVEEKECWQYWHEPSNLVVQVWHVLHGWCWELVEFDGTEADPLVVANWEDDCDPEGDIPAPFDTAEEAQAAALAWLESE